MKPLSVKAEKRIEQDDRYKDIPETIFDSENHSIVNVELVEKESKSKRKYHVYAITFRLSTGREFEDEIYPSKLEVFKEWLDDNFPKVDYKGTLYQHHEDGNNWVNVPVTLAVYMTEYGKNLFVYPYNPHKAVPSNAKLPADVAVPTQRPTPKPVELPAMPAPKLKMSPTTSAADKFITELRKIHLSDGNKRISAYDYLVEMYYYAISTSDKFSLIPSGPTLINKLWADNEDLWDTLALANLNQADTGLTEEEVAEWLKD